MRSLYITLIILLLSSPVFSQIHLGHEEESTLNENSECTTDLIVFPTITFGTVQIVIEHPPKGSYILELIDPPGKTIEFKLLQNFDDTDRIRLEFDLKHVHPGEYFIVFTSKGVRIARRIYIKD